MVGKLATALVAAQLCSLSCRRPKVDESITPTPEPTRSTAPSPLAPDAGADWVLARHAGGVFEVLMPSSPQERPTSDDSLEITTNDANAGDFALIVRPTTPDPKYHGDVEAMLDDCEKGIVPHLGHKTRPSRQLKVSGYSAREVFISSDGAPATEQAYLFCIAKMQYWFMLRHVGPPEARDKFFGSLKVDGVPRTSPGGSAVILKQ